MISGRCLRLSKISSVNLRRIQLSGLRFSPKSSRLLHSKDHHQHPTRPTSELGFRSSNRDPEHNLSDSDDLISEEGEISDCEWDIRTGRAILLLQHTLPSFFESGLISSPEKDPLQRLSTSFSTASGRKETDSIYSSNIYLAYTPPGPLPSPFPRTLHVEGLPLYMASSVFVRHTLKALYSDLHLSLTRFTLESPSSAHSNTLRSDNAEEATSVPSPLSLLGNGKHKSRGKILSVGYRVTGTTRVSGGAAQWDVASTYSFSSRTGLINKHVINSIYPAPHQAAYDAMRASFAKVFGFGMGLKEPGIGGQAATCDVVDRPER